jgi:ACT domain-containing protein
MTQDREAMAGHRIIISVLGHDRVGIIAAVANILAESNVNILDISQTIMQEFFTMMLIADMEQSSRNLAELKEMLSRKGEELGVRIDAQHEDVFRFMHRI